MHVTRRASAQTYVAPLHSDVESYRLQGGDESVTDTFWVGHSLVLPGGGAEMSASPCQRVYVLLDGELTVVTETESVTLEPLDSVHIAPGERRQMLNESTRPASVLVVMANAQG